METLPKQDAEHLRLLSIFHYVVGGLMALAACIPFIHLAVGLAFVSGTFGPPKPGEPSPETFGWLFIGVAVFGILSGWTIAACTVFAGRSLAQRRRYVFCMVVAGLMTVACVPLGTALGVFTIIVLVRPAVKQAFGTAITFVGD
jgi:hypothetical protein